MSKFDQIRPFYDTEVNAALRSIANDPMMKAIMNFTFPDKKEEEWKEQLSKTHSIRDFQMNFIYHAVNMVLSKTSKGLTTSGFENLEPNTAYLYITNHRDIILDTSLLNYSLSNHGCMMTASAIGDNLVQNPFLLTFSKASRNFIVQRGLPARELLESSKLLSEFISNSLMRENRSIWMAQRQGRTKDGNDATHKGVLKMLAMAKGDLLEMEYFKRVKIVPVSISYELDPTDVLKMPELLAKSRTETYVKNINEDIISIRSGILGQKKRIHIHVGKVLDREIDEIIVDYPSVNKQFHALGEAIDFQILTNYKLWPTNYIAHDLMTNSDCFTSYYTQEEKLEFENRLKQGVDLKDKVAVGYFLSMYANPVTNQIALNMPTEK